MITGRGYPAAGSLPEHLEMPEGASLDEALGVLRSMLPQGALSANALLAVSSKHLGTVGHHRQQQLRDGDELVIIAPMAGG